jgi:hypothetical protein
MVKLSGIILLTSLITNLYVDSSIYTLLYCNNSAPVFDSEINYSGICYNNTETSSYKIICSDINKTATWAFYTTSPTCDSSPYETISGIKETEQCFTTVNGYEYIINCYDSPTLSPTSPSSIPTSYPSSSPSITHFPTIQPTQPPTLDTHILVYISMYILIIVLVAISIGCSITVYKEKFNKVESVSSINHKIETDI